MAGLWFGEVCSSCSLTLLLGPAWVLLKYVLQTIFSGPVQIQRVYDGCDGIVCLIHLHILHIEPELRSALFLAKGRSSRSQEGSRMRQRNHLPRETLFSGAVHICTSSFAPQRRNPSIHPPLIVSTESVSEHASDNVHGLQECRHASMHKLFDFPENFLLT